MEVTGFLVVAPSTAGVNEKFSLGVKALCEPYYAGAACFVPSPGVVGRYNLSPRGIAYMDNVPREWAGVWGISERPAGAGNHRPIRTLGGEKDGQHVLDALRLGRRFGFVGGGDIHDGRPGDELHSRQALPEDYRNLWRQGIMGVWAKNLTREAVFEALWNRRVFATTNVRTLLRFSVCGAPMGSEVAHTGPRPIALQAAAPTPIATAEILRNGESLLTLGPAACEVSCETQDLDTGGSDCYYARITHEDGEMAWSSPVWVDVRQT